MKQQQNHANFQEEAAFCSVNQFNPSKKKTKVHLKRKKAVPEITISLDGLLGSAFEQMKKKPDPDLDLVLLPNSVLKGYIDYVYQEYQLPDPIRTDRYPVLNRYDSVFIERPKQSFQTPSLRKTRKFDIEDFSTEKKTRRYRSKTIERIIAMKEKFQQELQTDKNSQKSTFQPKIQIKLFEQVKMNKKKSTPNLRKNIENRYCLGCEEKLEENFIENHEKKCILLQNILRDKDFSLKTLYLYLDRKIMTLKISIQEDNMNLDEGINQLQQQISEKILQSDDWSRNNPKNSFSTLRIFKCWEKIDKLEWFVKMRNNLENRIVLEQKQVSFA